MKTLVRTGDVERALSLLDEMEQMNVQPTIVTYNTLLLAAAEAPLWYVLDSWIDVAAQLVGEWV